ncbi:unnamed protein product [Lymnaea stagnalis]|uniref:TRPM SLOG domain-containing protein n=1 Tax=Lymnaea stagnalis TaxID=6523 RepID=A0AAV2HUF3_LYMST
MDDKNFKFKYRTKTKEWKIMYGEETSPESASSSLPSLSMNLNKKNEIFISQDETVSFIKKREINQRDCKKIIKEDKTEICQCGRLVKEHSKGVQKRVKAVKWIKDKHSEKIPCDSFGEIQFSGFGTSISNTLVPYARICYETEAIVVWDLMIKYWKMPPPRLLISVTGGAKKFKLKPRLSSFLKQGLVGSAVKTGAWIITGGTKSGVMEFVGEAVKDHMLIHSNSTDNKCVVLGIASWGVVGNKKALNGNRVQKNGFWPAIYDNEELQEKRAHLDPNHTHFLLVDDGTEGKFGVEIEFRSVLEKFISGIESDEKPKEKSSEINEGQRSSCEMEIVRKVIQIPVVLVVVEGGLGTMETVQQSLEKKTPVVIVKGSGRAADFLAYAYEETIKSCDKNSTFIFTLEFEKKMEEAEFKNKIKEQLKKAFEKEEEQEHALEKVKKCFVNNLITVFDLGKCESVKDIDREILCAILKANKSESESQLNLALAWNRYDIARQQIFTSENRQKWKLQTEYLHEAMLTALVQDKPEFVQLFLDNGVDLKEFLTVKHLMELYKQSLNSDESEASILKNLAAYEEQSWPSCFTCQSYDDDNRNQSVLLQSINKVLVRLLGDESFDFYTDEKYLVKFKGQQGSEITEGCQTKNEASLIVKK